MITVFIVFLILLIIGVPVAFAIGASGMVFFLQNTHFPLTHVAQLPLTQVQSISMLAIPLFILAGNIMNKGGIARRLVNFSKLFVGWIPGSLAQANIVGNMLFGALSGSSVAAASAMGGCIYPIQKDEGYDPAFATAVNIASAPTGLLIPPTSAFIV